MTTSSRWSAISKVGALALATFAGWRGRAELPPPAPPALVAHAVPAPPPPPDPPPTCAPAAREQPLDTDVTPAPTPKPRSRKPIPAIPNRNRRVRTPADEDLPAWVPVRGRLTVVESSDLAENLGLVPIGTAKKNPNEIISVADLLEEERKARALAPPPAEPAWTYIMGESFVGL